MCKKKLLDFLSITKMNSKQITDLNLKYKTKKLEDDIGENLDDLGY